MGTSICGPSPFIYKYLVTNFFYKKILIIMFVSTNIYRPYISQVNNSIDPITPYWSALINYLYQYIDQLIKNPFNPINRFKC